MGKRSRIGAPEVPEQAGLPSLSGPVDPTLDQWIQHQLTNLYDDVLNEPLPPEFLAILGKVGKPPRA